jgi:transposase InsO family protein
MTEIISNFVKNCSICQTNKIIKIKKYGEPSQVGPAQQPYDIVSIDTVGGLSGYNSKKQYIHIAIDHFTRYLWTLSSKTQSDKDFINLIKIVIQTNKHKMILAGNRYTGIKSNEFSNFLDKNDIKLMFISVNCPQSNGLCERVN